MVIKLGINGFGRIGRIIFRAGLKKADLEIAAINDPAIDMEYICYLIKFDSTHGKFCGSVTHTKDEIYVNGSRIKIFQEKLPTTVPWQAAGVEYVIEASGMFTSLDKASGHLASDGVKRVIVAAPSVDAPMIILGVNNDELHEEHKVISCASSTLYCLAPLVKILEEEFGLVEGFLTSIHAMTPSLKPVDGLCLRGNWREHRGVHQNIIPSATGACRALGRVVRAARGKLAGTAYRVPVAGVSVLDLTLRLNSNTTLNEIVKSVEKASNSAMKNIIRISHEQAVSSDFIGESHSCVLDVDMSLQLKPDFFKLVCWYENEYSYACRVLDTIFFSEKQLLTTVNVNEHALKQPLMQTGLRKKVLGSASYENGHKSKQHRLMLKKPITSHNLGTTQSYNTNLNCKKKCELCKIWNDNPEVSKPCRQNRNSFFHCVAIRQNQEEIECIKAHERLEMLKQEFTKMVNITESLLKKSCIGNAKLEHELVNKKETIETVDILPNNVKDTQHSSKTCTEINKVKQNMNPVFDTNGDPSSSISSTKINNVFNKPTREKTIQESEAPSSPKRNYRFQNKLIIFNNVPKNKSAQHNDDIKSFASIELKHDGAINKVLPEEIIKIHDDEEDYNENELEKDLEVKCAILGNNEQSQTERDDAIVRRSKTAEIGTVEKETRLAASDSGFFSLFIKNSAAVISQNIPVIKDDNNDINKTEINNLENINLKKEVDKDANTLNDMKHTFIDSAVKTPAGALSDLCQSILHTVVDNGFSSAERISTGLDFTSECVNPANTRVAVSAVEVINNLQDIYDKLDSASGTDSNNSFHINERKSQVINFTDLTTSLEDLNRLDKICKIIEISDELSNKLFSALESNREDTGEIEIRKKKWSFKDLCERIKLDDFCEKVFGKPSRY